MSDEQLRSLATISVNGLPGNPTLPEDKAIRSILDTVNKSVTVFIEFVCSTKEPINKRTQACIEICNLHSALNDLARLYTKNVCTRNTEEEILTQVQNSVKDSVDLALNNAAAPPLTYANIASQSGGRVIRKPSSTAKRHKVLIFPTKDATNIDSSTKTKEILTKTVNPKDLCIKPDRLIKIRNNGVMIESSTIEVEKLIGDKSLQKAGLEARKPKILWPKLVIHNVPNPVSAEELSERIEEQVQKKIRLPENWCAYAGTLGPKKTTDASWILEVHPTVWKSLTSEGHIYIDWHSCRVENFVKLTKCFKCQRYGHVAKYCNSEESCGFCTSSEHETKDCPHKNLPAKHSCINCIRAKFRDHSHHTNAESCPIFKRKLEEYLSSICYEE
jgi:hypothetical protein